MNHKNNITSLGQYLKFLVRTINKNLKEQKNIRVECLGLHLIYTENAPTKTNSSVRRLGLILHNTSHSVHNYCGWSGHIVIAFSAKPSVFISVFKNSLLNIDMTIGSESFTIINGFLRSFTPLFNIYDTGTYHRVMYNCFLRIDDLPEYKLENILTNALPEKKFKSIYINEDNMYFVAHNPN